MPTRTADAVWTGSLIEGKGQLKTGSGALSGPYDWRSRSADGATTSPEELLGAAHAGCYSMAFSHILSLAGFTPTRIHTVATVSFEKQGDGFAVTKIALVTEAQVPRIDNAAFQTHAKSAKENCPISKALASTPITLEARLLV
jgi:lipoyl-dependent peroxiredoxin